MLRKVHNFQKKSTVLMTRI